MTPPAVDPELQAILEKHEPRQANLLAVLHDVTHHYGYVPEALIESIADYLNMTAPVVFGIMTYYGEFRPQRPGQAALAFCAGVACRMAKIDRIEHRFAEAFNTNVGEFSDDNRVDLRHFECFGACSLAPLISINGEYVRNVTGADIDRIIAQLKEE